MKITILKQKSIGYAICMIGLAGCISSDNGIETPDTGILSELTIKLAFPAVEHLRAGGDPNATEKEVKIETANVFIYTPQGFCESQTAIQGEWKDGVYVSTQIPAATGEKKIFVGVNLPSPLVDKLKNGMSNELTQVPQTLTVNDLVTANALAMTSPLIACEVKKQASENVLTVPIKRLTAKITVEKSPSLETGGAAGKTENIVFAVANFNQRSFLIQPDDKHDPNWSGAAFNPNEFLPRYDETNDAAYSFVPINEANISQITAYNALYASENTSELHRKKEITRVLVRAVFTPDSIVVKEGTRFVNKHATALGITSPVDFWLIAVPRPENELLFFTTYSIAVDYATTNAIPVNDANIVKYTGGKCYWDMFLNKNNSWDVQRNDYHQCVINRIMAPGRALPSVPDPDNPPPADTEIDANITVTPWTVIADEYNLVP
ncbi:MAG: Mfa1 family fimbria major subunit [Bacteroidales bacterium]|jgi:hypothetical protein|nr:Mfa1 family fimbria major subunit [Bacteroidales bacterium]